MTEYTSDTARWVFECTECGEIWVNPDSPVSGHFCDRHPKASGVPDGEPAEVEWIKHPGGERE